MQQKDADAVLGALTALGIVVPAAGGDAQALRRSIAYFLANLGRQLEQQETVAAIGEELFAVAVDSVFRFPATFTFVLRAFATLEVRWRCRSREHDCKKTNRKPTAHHPPLFLTQGIGKALDPAFSFAEVAAPYAAELLDLRSGSAGAQRFALERLGAAAADAGAAAAAVPARVARADRVLAQLESGELKLRARVLEGERAARRAGIMQTATLHGVGVAGFANAALQLGLAGRAGAATAAALAAAGLAGLVLWGLRRVKRLDRFEGAMKGQGSFPPN